MRSQRNQPTRNQSGYPNFEMPWSLSFSFNYRLSRPAKRIESQTATLSTNFSLGVTPLWSVSGQTGYDFIERTLSTTRLSIRRDLGCWFMSFSWVPFGRYQSYSFNLQVKSGQLSQLLQLQIPNKGGEDTLISPIQPDHVPDTAFRSCSYGTVYSPVPPAGSPPVRTCSMVNTDHAVSEYF